MQKQKITRFLLFTGFGMALAAGFFLKSRFFSRLLEQNTSKDVLFHVDTTEKIIALTIDDGPHEELTAEILDTLAHYQVPATFFIIGSQVAGNEALLRRAVREGHELGNHLMYDERSILLDASEFSRQLKETHDLLASFGPVRWFRPGSGWYNERMLDQIQPYEYRAAVGSVYPYDAQFRSVDFASSYILSNAQPGSIIILHDGRAEREATVDILHRILPTLQNRGYRFVTLSELTETADPQTISVPNR